ncbi:MAG: transposase [Treponema sp.]|jgi:putative transposase|nr:transposase [Treponema sp.]
MEHQRILLEGATYHVTSEINRYALELLLPEIKELLLTYIKKAKEKYPFQLFNFCIMDNHIHLLIKPELGQSLSKIMQWIKGNFAKHWNTLHNKKGGHLWGKRFFSEIIKDVRHFWQVFTYIDENPKRANMVKRAEDWKFGGLYHHLQRRMDVVDIPRIAIRELFFLDKVAAG